MYCVQMRIKNGLEVKDPKRYMSWYLNEKDGKASKSMYKAAVALNKALFVKFRSVPNIGDSHNPSFSELIKAIDITKEYNKPQLSELDFQLHQHSKDTYSKVGSFLHFYYRDNNVEYIEPYLFRVWLYVTHQVIPYDLRKDIEVISIIPEVIELARKYQPSSHNIAVFSDLTDILFNDFNLSSL